jgi:hypothetical protein
MNIFEALGTGYVLLMACLGQLAVGYLAYEGLKRVVGRLVIGQETEDAAVRDFIVKTPLVNAEVEGAQ